MDTGAAPQLVVGTAGHIDHGKSRLVLALTGTDPDRLPEEKARGMTIDLGFAHARYAGCEIFFVDVPGHERFIRNMVAGATGVDLALLVVAADDSVMPQTREHAEVLRLLGLDRCLLVLTKMDLVDDEWADQVEEEARGLLASLGLEPIACLRTSAETGRGLDELRQTLAAVARDPQRPQPPYRWFRLPIDRAFNVAGRGTVVTGSVAHGAVQRDQELELWPRGGRVRVRDMQVHNDACEAASGRTRLGLNLAGVGLDEVDRGCELAMPGYLQPTRCLDVWLASLRMPGKVRRQTLRVRLHIATSDVLAELRLPAKPDSDVTRGQFAQLTVAGPVVATWGQHFIVRDESATRTLGGGRVLRPQARRWTARRPADIAGLNILLRGQPEQRLETVIHYSGWKVPAESGPPPHAGLPTPSEPERQRGAQSEPRAPASDSVAAGASPAVPSEPERQRGAQSQPERQRGATPRMPAAAALATHAGLPDAEDAARLLNALTEKGVVRRLEGASQRLAVHAAHLTALIDDLNRRLGAFLEANPRLPGVARSEWPHWMPAECPERFRPVLADWLVAQGHVALALGHVVPRGHRGALSADDQTLLEAMLREFDDGAFQPPDPDALRCRTPRNAKRLRELMDLAIARGDLVRIADGVWLHGRRWNELITRVTAALRERGPLTVSEIRTLLNSSRKYMVPIVERLDAVGITRRTGDQRVPGPKAPPPP